MNNVLYDYEHDDKYGTYKTIRELHKVQNIEDAVCLYLIAKHHDIPFNELDKALADDYHNDVLDAIAKIVREYNKLDKTLDYPDDESMINCTVSMYQMVAQVERFRRTKQVFTFDSNFLTELAQTDTNFLIRYNIFHTLPYTTFYLDLANNKELCTELGMEGILLNVYNVKANEFDYWILGCVLYQNGQSVAITSQILPNSVNDTELAVSEIIDSVTQSVYLTDQTGVNYKQLFPLLIQILLYLSSYEPDIRETVVSKSRRAASKRNKSNKKDKPEREYIVGERFGAAFKKWSTTVEKQHNTTTSGTKKIKPHVRRAHWHRYWIGSKKNNEQTLITKWLHECYCGLDDELSELDTVKHKVTGE